jgi:hypothetical protein
MGEDGRWELGSLALPSLRALIGFVFGLKEIGKTEIIVETEFQESHF